MSDAQSEPGPRVEQRMRDAGLPAGTLAARRTALPVAVQELHGRVLTAIADTGQPPAEAALAADAASLGVELGDALGVLAHAELLFVTPDRDGVLGRDTDVGGWAAFLVRQMAPGLLAGAAAFAVVQLAVVPWLAAPPLPAGPTLP